MRSLKYVLMACGAAAFIGCATTDDDWDGRGTPPNEPTIYHDSNDALLEGPNRGVNTNYFGPVNSGPEAARGPGTPSGHYDYRGR